jgi:hypothetical protein
MYVLPACMIGPTSASLISQEWMQPSEWPMFSTHDVCGISNKKKNRRLNRGDVIKSIKRILNTDMVGIMCSIEIIRILSIISGTYHIMYVQKETKVNLIQLSRYTNARRHRGIYGVFFYQDTSKLWLAYCAIISSRLFRVTTTVLPTQDPTRTTRHVVGFRVTATRSLTTLPLLIGFSTTTSSWTWRIRHYYQWYDNRTTISSSSS